MLKLFTMLLLLLVPFTAFAQECYDLSCENVTEIHICRIEAADWDIDSHNGFFHVLCVMLSPQGGESLLSLVDAAPWHSVEYRGDEHRRPNIILTANGGALQNDAPVWNAYEKTRLYMAVIREEDAFAAARAICPALVPQEVTIGWPVREYESKP